MRSLLWLSSRDDKLSSDTDGVQPRTDLVESRTVLRQGKYTLLIQFHKNLAKEVESLDAVSSGDTLH